MFVHYTAMALLLLLSAGTHAQLQRFHFSQPKMGSPFHIIFYAATPAQANAAADQCFKLIDSLNAIFSDYLPDSEINRLSALAGTVTNPVAVSPALFDVLLRSKKAYEKSKGAFDITAGPLVQLWRQARKANRFPHDTLIKKAKLLTGFQYVEIDTINKSVWLKKRGMQLDLGGIAKGYTAQQVIEWLSQHGIHQALADAGGDIATGDAPPGTGGWIIGINVPETENDLQNKKLLLHHMAVATSGDVYQYMTYRGKKYSHIANPHTGYGITAQRNVTVIAKDGATADWLATACSILPLRQAHRLAASQQAHLLIARLKKGRILFHFSKDFANYFNNTETLSPL